MSVFFERVHTSTPFIKRKTLKNFGGSHDKSCVFLRGDFDGLTFPRGDLLRLEGEGRVACFSLFGAKPEEKGGGPAPEKKAHFVCLAASRLAHAYLLCEIFSLPFAKILCVDSGSP